MRCSCILLSIFFSHVSCADYICSVVMSGMGLQKILEIDHQMRKDGMWDGEIASESKSDLYIKSGEAISVLNPDSGEIDLLPVSTVADDSELFRHPTVISRKYSLMITRQSGEVAGEWKTSYQVWNTKTGEQIYSDALILGDFHFILRGRYLTANTDGRVIVFDLEADGMKKPLLDLEIPGLPEAYVNYLAERRSFIFVALNSTTLINKDITPIEIQLDERGGVLSYRTFGPQAIQATTFEELMQKRNAAGKSQVDLAIDGLKNVMSAPSVYGVELVGQDLWLYGGEDKHAFISVYNTESHKRLRTMRFKAPHGTGIVGMSFFGDQYFAIAAEEYGEGLEKRSSVLLFPYHANDLEKPLATVFLDPKLGRDGKIDFERIFSIRFNEYGQLWISTSERTLKLWSPLVPIFNQ